MILDIKESYDIIYQCDGCKREPKMITVQTLGEFRRAVGEYGKYFCYRCKSKQKGEHHEKD